MTVVNVYGLGRNMNEETDVYIGRPGKWGNPFVIGKDGSRAEVIEKYRRYIQERPDLTLSIGELEGKNLVCHCRPMACHGDVLDALVNEWRMWKRQAVKMACLEIEELFITLDVSSKPTLEEIQAVGRASEEIARKHSITLNELLYAQEGSRYLDLK